MAAPRLALLVASVVLAAGVSACGSGDVSSTDAPGTTVPSTAGGSGPEPVVRVRATGGFLPAPPRFEPLPVPMLWSDGRLVHEGPRIAVYPPPVLPPLLEADVGEAGVATVLQRAEAAGLLDPAPDYGTPPVADATTTVVEVWSDGERHVHEIYALGLAATGPGGPPGSPGALDGSGATPPGGGLGLSDEQLERRGRVEAFLAELSDPGALVDGEVADDAYEAERIAVRARPAPPEPPEPDAPTLEWPLGDVDLDATGPCTLLEGDRATRLVEALPAATTLTRWTQDGTEHVVDVRPLLPGEATCADVTVS